MNINDINISKIQPLIPADILLDEFPITETITKFVLYTRTQIQKILSGELNKILVVVGPCSIHDPKSAFEYANKLKTLLASSESLNQRLLIVMRVYFEKPRTCIGWKGLINDPNMDNTYKINNGLSIARKLLLDINNIGIPVGCEFLDTITPQYLSDLVSWGAIGARTTESQVHRELASGLSMPIGFKNGTDGNTKICIDAIKCAMNPHTFLGVTKQGLCSIVHTKGNSNCHVILRGAITHPNYEKKYVDDVIFELNKQNLQPRVMIDCSHDNSQKNYKNQETVLDNIISQLKESNQIMGVMIESHLIEGRQDIDLSKEMTYGQSVTDGCIGWDKTCEMISKLSLI